MSLPALMPLMPTLPASAQPSEGQPPLPPAELPDEMATRDSVDGRGRATFIPRGEESAQTSDSLRRGPMGSAGLQPSAVPVSRALRSGDAPSQTAARKPGVALSPAGINPRLLAMAFTQPIIQRLLGHWSEGRTVSLSIPASPGLPEPLAEALTRAVSPALMKAILAVGMRQDGVVLATPPGAWSEPTKATRLTKTTPTTETTKLTEPTQSMEKGVSISPGEVINTDHQSGSMILESSRGEIPSSSISASAAATTTASASASTDGKGGVANPSMMVSLTLLPLPVQPEQGHVEREPNRKRGGPKDDESDSGLPGLSRVRRVGRMLRGQVDLGPRGLLNFEIRSLNGRFSVTLGATPHLGEAARPGLRVLEAALNRVPGFTELHWNG